VPHTRPTLPSSYNYVEAVLSKFHPRNLTSESYTWSNRLKDERYFKLILQENANKGWNPDKDGYFQHLDPPLNVPLKTEPPGSPSFSTSAHVPIRVFNVDAPPQKSSPNSSGPSTPTSNSSSFSAPQGHFQRSQPSPFKGYNGIPVQPIHASQQHSLKRPADLEVGHLEEMMDLPVQHKSARFSPEESYHEPGIVGQLGGGMGPHAEGDPQTHEMDEDEIPRITDREDVYFTVIEHPLKHQVKEFNILPAGILQLMRHYQSTPSDYIVVKLLCDPKMDKGEIFLTAVSTHYSQSSTGEISIPSLKVSQKMLPGRTKGFIFRLMYELVLGGKIMQSEVTDDFFIWSNVNQKGYPRKERDAFISQRIESNKKKVKPKRKTPGRPRKKESDELDFEEE